VAAAASRQLPAGNSRGEPPQLPWTKEEAAASPTPVEASWKSPKGGGGWQQARAPTKVEKLQSQVMLFEKDPDAFDPELLKLTRLMLEAAKAERDGSKPTFTRLSEAQARLSRKRNALPNSAKAVLDPKARLERAMGDLEKDRAAIEAEVQEVERIQAVPSEENADGTPSQGNAAALGCVDAISALFLLSKADEVAAFRKVHEDKEAADRAAAAWAKADEDTEMADEFKTVAPGRGRRPRPTGGADGGRRTSRSRSGGRDVKDVVDELRAAYDSFEGFSGLDDGAKEKKFKEIAEAQEAKRTRAYDAPAPGVVRSG
jgi:hypothetical protein